MGWFRVVATLNICNAQVRLFEKDKGAVFVMFNLSMSRVSSYRCIQNTSVFSGLVFCCC